MKISRTLFITAVMGFVVASCGEKKPSTDIIAKKSEKTAPAAPAKMQDYNHKEDVDWIGKTYSVEIKRTVDVELPMIVDDLGNKFYDNKITVRVLRPDGSVFFDKIFSKADFASCMTEGYMKKNALLGIVLDKADGDNLCFAASVGSPDVLSDEYMPLIITLSRTGNVSIKKDTRLDSNNDGSEDEDEGV